MMTIEERNNKIYKCKTCGKKSKGHIAMMRHAWIHRESMMAGKQKSKELVPVVKTFKTNGIPLLEATTQSLNSEMTAVELLDKIYQQRNFINSMAKFIEGMLTTK